MTSLLSFVVGVGEREPSLWVWLREDKVAIQDV